MDASIHLHRDRSRYWHWQVADEAGVPVVVSAAIYDDLPQMLGAMDDIATLLKTVREPSERA